jgi:transposase InsO family protein
VGRGKTVVKHHFGDDTEVLLVEHRMPLRSADEVILVNGKQFDSTDFKEFCTYLGTRLCFALVYHPQSNGAVERANGIIFAGIKRNITELPKNKWAKELPRVI